LYCSNINARKKQDIGIFPKIEGGGFNMKKHILFITFDLIRKGDLETSLAMGSILAFLKSDSEISRKWLFEHKSYNIYGESSTINAEEEVSKLNLNFFNTIALSAYIWADNLAKDFVVNIRKSGFRGEIVLGGYQISNSLKELKFRYADIDIYIHGYAELALREYLRGRTKKQFINYSAGVCDPLPIYSSGIIKVPFGAKNVRIETKRGCPFACSFCRHRIEGENIRDFKLEIPKNEISFLLEQQVEKINVIDPIFNFGKTHLKVLEHINTIKHKHSKTQFSFQCRLENITNKDGEKFLDMVSGFNHILEFGLQTTDIEISKKINRVNNMKLVEKAFGLLAKYKIKYEINLIYGLPGQTVSKFKKDILFLENHGCGKILAFPLKLLPGTKLWEQKDIWQIKEEAGEYGIPSAVSCSSFSREEYKEMQEIVQTKQLTKEKV
jgi:radical SAM superfamily enzyme YgiQ (UPF0313 family)